MNPINPQELVEYARTWIGTPWHHNQCCKGVGVDCIRFTNDCYSHFGANTGEIANYQRAINDDRLLDHLDSLPSTVRLEDDTPIQPGELLVFRTLKIPRHVGIATREGWFIHADNFQYAMKVHEQRMARWESRIVARYVFYS